MGSITTDPEPKETEKNRYPLKLLSKVYAEKEADEENSWVSTVFFASELIKL